MSIHTIHFIRGINPDTFVGLQNTILSAREKGASEIHIHMSSEGGQNNQGFAAYYFLRSLDVPLTTHCIGNIESMAVMMFLAGEKRLIVPHGKVKIHPMHWGFSEGTVDHDRLVEYVDSLNFDAKRYANIYTERTEGAKQDIDVDAHLAGKAKILNAEHCINAGIATNIKEALISKDSTVWWV